VIQSGWDAVLTRCRETGIPVAVTALSPRAEDIRSARLNEMAVVICSEGRGVRPEVLENADRELIIPMNPKCESLNAAVAATIVMWQMKL
jgi:TrmH family RNA methyltransferase